MLSQPPTCIHNAIVHAEPFTQGGWQRGLDPRFYDCTRKEIRPSETKHLCVENKHGGRSVDSCYRKSFVVFFSQSATVTLFTGFGELGSTLEGIPDVLDGIKTLSRGEFNRRKHMFTFDGEFTESFLLPGSGIMISKLVIGAFRTNVLHREDVLADIK